MLAKLREVHAGVAVHAVAHVNAQAPSQATQVAEGTVIDAAPLLIVVQVADMAIVASQLLLALMALSCMPPSNVCQLTIPLGGARNNTTACRRS